MINCCSKIDIAKKTVHSLKCILEIQSKYMQDLVSKRSVNRKESSSLLNHHLNVHAVSTKKLEIIKYPNPEELLNKYSGLVWKYLCCKSKKWITRKGLQDCNQYVLTALIIFFSRFICAKYLLMIPSH